MEASVINVVSGDYFQILNDYLFKKKKKSQILVLHGSQKLGIRLRLTGFTKFLKPVEEHFTFFT